MLFEALALILGAVHFAIPLGYYAYLKKYLWKSWNIKVDEGYMPALTVMVPTYNEANTIEKRLDNIYELDYPRNKLEIIVIDSASTDGTPELVAKWVKSHQGIQLRVVKQGERKGKISALNPVLRKLVHKTEVVVMTDSDCIWKPSAMKNAVKYLADPSVGAVTCSIYPIHSGASLSVGFDENYRNYNNVVRIAESKGFSTPIAHGPLIAYKREVLDRIGGIPTWSGADDSTPFTLVVLRGYRSIQVPDAITYEYVPKAFKDNLRRRIRRAHHLVEHFLRTGREMKKSPTTNTLFNKIFEVEKYLHIVNPWLLLLSILSLMMTFVMGTSWLALATFASGLLLLAISRAFRTWVLTQLILIYASIQYLVSGSMIKWEPIKR